MFLTSLAAFLVLEAQMGAFISRFFFSWRRGINGAEREDDSLGSVSSIDSLIPHEQASPSPIRVCGSDLKDSPIDKLPLDLLLRLVKQIKH